MSRNDNHSDGTITAGSENGRGAVVPVGDRPVMVPAMAWPYGLPVRPEILTAKPGLVEMLHALRRRWLLAVGVSLAVGALMFAVMWMLVPVRYEAVSWLKVAENPYMTNFEQTSRTDFQTYKKTQAELLKTTPVLNAALQDSSIVALPTIQAHKNDAANWLSEQLLVDYPREAEVLRVSMKGDRPDDLAKIVNAVTAAFMSEIVNNEKQEMFRQRDSLAETVRKNNTEINTKRVTKNNLEKLHEVTGSERWQISRKMQTDALDALKRERDGYQSQVRGVQMQVAVLKAQRKLLEGKEIPDSLIESEVNKDSDVLDLQRNLRILKQRIRVEADLARNPDNAPSVMQLKAHLGDIEDQIQERKTEIKDQLLARINDASGEGGNNVTIPLLETQLLALAAGWKQVDAAIAKKMEEIQKSDSFNEEYEIVRAQLIELEAVNGRLSQQLKSLTATTENYQARVRILEPAQPPNSSDRLRKILGSAFAGLFGFGVTLFGVAWIEFQSRRLNSPREVNEGLGVRVLGQLPNLSGRAWRRVQAGRDGDGALQSLLMESIDSVRAALVHCATITAPRVVLITSAEPREGRTTVASQLAASLARAGRNTLLVDGDLRNPAAHLVFDVPLEPGLCELLRGQAVRESAVHATPQARLSVLPAGRCDMLSIQALAGERLERLVDAWRTEYDFVVIDSGSVLQVADPLLIGQHVDVAVLSAQRDISRVPKVYEACERLSSVGVTVLGVVINGVSDRANGHRLVPQTIDAA